MRGSGGRLNIRNCTIALLWLAVAIANAQTAVIQTITVKGNKEVSTEAILAAMRTKVGQPYVQATLDTDKTTLENLGFFQAVDVRANAIDDTNREVIVQVTEWPVVKEIRVVGNKGLTTEEILKEVDAEVGKVFNLRTRAPSVQKIEALYTKKGLFGRVEDMAMLVDSPGTLSISVIELTVNSVSVQGNTRTKLSVMKRLIKTRAGDPFRGEKWTADLRRLVGTQWFESVRNIENQPEPGKLDLIADVKEARTGNFGIGVQLDPRNSLAGTLKLSDTNFRGSGQSVGFSILQGTAGGGPSIELDYGNPFFDDRGTALNVSLYSRLIYRFQGSGFGNNDSPTEDDIFTERRTGAAVSIGKSFNDYLAGNFAIRFEDIKTSDLNTDASTGFIQQDGTLATMTLGLTRNRRDVDIDPARGDWFRLEVEPGFANITKVGGDIADSLGNKNYIKTTAEYRFYWSDQKPRTRNELESPRRVLAFRARYGVISGDAPFFEQYFMGGASTIRGYEEDRFWGKQSFLTTLEYRLPVQKSLSLSAFMDYGGAWGGFGTVGEFTQSRSTNLKLGYGVGVSFRSPLGPLRLDLAFDDRGKTRTHFQIATSF
ncbi:MAG: BamA/TamA family outer membrane protein [Chlorobia bacterium]|nr:BamA/TamA family outer membrane protein [Fimbriimonadaceae bacterium]